MLENGTSGLMFVKRRKRWNSSWSCVFCGRFEFEVRHERVVKLRIVESKEVFELAKR